MLIDSIVMYIFMLILIKMNKYLNYLNNNYFREINHIKKPSKMKDDRIKFLTAQVEALQKENKQLQKDVTFYKNLAKYKDFINA